MEKWLNYFQPAPGHILQQHLWLLFKLSYFQKQNIFLQIFSKMAASGYVCYQEQLI